jgi:hypothetical protein
MANRWLRVLTPTVALIGCSACGAIRSGDNNTATGEGGGGLTGVASGGATSPASGGNTAVGGAGGTVPSGNSGATTGGAGTAGSGGSSTSAQGGSAGTAASNGKGGSSSGASGSSSGGSMAAGGSAANLCPPPPPRCPTKTLKSIETFVVSETRSADQFVGVTAIDGAVDVVDAVGLTAFDCLETVSGSVSLADGTSGAQKFDSAFPNLVSARDVDVHATFSTQPIECLLQSLARVETLEVTGSVRGTLNLAALTTFTRVVVLNSDLTRVILPSSGSFNVMQLVFRGNDSLREIAGFQNVTLTGAPGATAPVYSLGFLSNPSLSGCRILELADLFREAGFIEESLFLGMPTCP